MQDNSTKHLFGLKLKNYRKRCGYTQEQLCNALNLDISGYSKVENGKNYPSIETICKVMNFLKINPIAMFDFIEYSDEQSTIDELIIFEEIKSLSAKDKNKVLNFIKMIKD